MKVEIVQVQVTEKSVLQNLIELYEYDFSEFNDADVNMYGLYGYKYFDCYWTEDTRYPFFIKVDGIYAGFVLINEHCHVLKDPGSKTIAEFFVMKKYRRKGIGKRVAFQAFNKFPGQWEVLQHGENEPSKLFWRKVISEYTNNNYKHEKAKTELWEGQALTFNNSQNCN
jgi:predicted acetyltransferase